MRNIIVILSVLATTLLSCNRNAIESDAFGNFESKEVIVSAEQTGKILQMDASEGSEVKAGQKVGLIDTTMLFLQLRQLEAQKAVAATKVQNIVAQIAIQNESKKTLMIEKQRITKLLADGAATQQQMDNVLGRIAVIDETIASFEVQKATVAQELNVYDRQMDVLREQISRCTITSPIDGTVTDVYVEAGELISTGKSVFKISNLNKIQLRAYVDGTQLANIKMGQDVWVMVDSTDTELRKLGGKIAWVSPEAEFTPKIIQTKDERVNMVYAILIDVKNDGTLKNGMPGEVVFDTTEQE